MKSRRYRAPEAPVVPEKDLRYVAEKLTGDQEKLLEAREDAVKDISELKQARAPVTEYMRTRQAPHIRVVTAARDIGLISLLVLLMAWPDKNFAKDLIYGLPAVGKCVWSDVYGYRDVGDRKSLEYTRM